MSNVRSLSAPLSLSPLLPSLTSPLSRYGGREHAAPLAERLWGDVWFLNGQFSNAPPASAVESTRRSFVSFVLEPLYKVYSLILSADPDPLVDAMARLSVVVTASEARLDVAPLVRLCLSRLLAGDAKVI